MVLLSLLVLRRRTHIVKQYELPDIHALQTQSYTTEPSPDPAHNSLNRLADALARATLRKTQVPSQSPSNNRVIPSPQPQLRAQEEERLPLVHNVIIKQQLGRGIFFLYFSTTTLYEQ
jgi:hypothetical protein